MSNIKRISRELTKFRESPPSKYIRIHVDDSDITIWEVFMIGARDTPYSRMFMRFQVFFNKDYPIKPPKVIFASSYNRKIHPNVFPGGYLCLSTLENGKSPINWSAAMSMGSLLQTIYTMFNKEMIQSVENTHSHEKSSDYFPAIMYDTFYITSKLLEDEKIEEFKEIMRKYVRNHKDWYLRKLERLSKEYDGKNLPNYYLPKQANFKSLIPSFKNI